ncbi:sensor histidine kinase [Streptomyces sp. NPDC088554]|uniref:sensor histidine kinase n=1 Tax=Streptomyces sp. NPDC088554 TaxID=3365865 RepID=UPI0038187307
MFPLHHMLLKRVPPGVWAGASWFVAALYPLVRSAPGTLADPAPPPNALDDLRGQLCLALASALALIGCAVLTRRPWPGLVLLLVSTGAFAVAWRLWEVPSLQFLAVDVAVGFLSAARPRRASLPFAGAALAALALFLAMRQAHTGESGTPSEPYVALTVVVAWLIGNLVYQSRAYAEKLRAQLLTQVTAQASAAERLRIGRELHDMVAHSIGIIALQAGAAARVFDTQPENARQAMLAVENAARETLAGLRRMLVVLRQADDQRGKDDPEGRERAPLGPAATLADVERLAETTTAAGVRVRVRWRGEQRPLPPEIDLSAFRIVQESVTNVVRHSGTGSCEVTVNYGAKDLAIEITDRGTGAGATAGTGYGLAGMRERVALMHGEFSAGPRPGGGFRIAARLPVPPAHPSPAPQPPAGAQ